MTTSSCFATDDKEGSTSVLQSCLWAGWSSIVQPYIAGTKYCIFVDPIICLFVQPTVTGGKDWFTEPINCK